jgi:hypothetical protein
MFCRNMLRSGLFERLFIVSNPQLERILGDVPIMGYNDKLNELLVSTFHMINVYNNNEPVVNNFSDFKEQAEFQRLGSQI